MQGLKQPETATTYPSPFIRPELKDKGYHLQCAKAIYWTGWQTYNNPYGNYYRNIWDETRKWARGIQTNAKFALRPPAKNDHTKNPLLKQINFSAVNEMVKYCDIFVTMLEQSDLDITATAINPAAAAKRSEIKAQAEAYRQLRPFYQQLDQAAGMPVSPNNPIDQDFETKQELETFFQIGFKLKQELLVELGNEVVLNESDWSGLRKLIAEDLRDTGYYMLRVATDSNNKIRVNYIDPVNSGWEDFRGHKVNQVARFWTIDVKTAAQIVAETGGSLSEKDLIAMATMAQGKFGNPMLPSNSTSNGTYGYINSDSPYNMWFFDNWKFPVLTVTWEDWDVYKYRRIQRTGDNATESYGPVDYNYRDKNNGEPYMDKLPDGTTVEKKVIVEKSHLHNYRECKWVIGTEVCYDWGMVPNCPRNPHDIRYALSPVKVYRATGAPIAQRLRPIAEIMQNAWYKFQNEIARTRPSGVRINVRMLDNIATLEGKKINRYQVLELFNEEGTLLYSDRAGRDDMGNTQGSIPIEKIDNVDINALQRWVNVINECSYRMQMESGLNEFAIAATQNPEQSATAVKAGIGAANKAIQQYSDAILIAGEQIAIDVTGKLHQLINAGKAGGYISSIGESILKDGYIDDNVTIFTYGIKVTARPTRQEREELKAEIRQAFGGLGTPMQGSPYLSDLLYLESAIDGGTNLKVVALMAAAMHKRNIKAMQDAEMQKIQANAESQQQIAASAAQMQVQTETTLSQLRIQEYNAKIQADMELAKLQSQLKTENQIITNGNKSQHKVNEKLVESQLAV